MKKISTAFILTFLLTGQLSFAVECNGIVATETEVLDQNFTVADKVKGHGGEEFTMVGKENQVIFMADGKWLGISWHQNGVLVAETVNLIKDLASQPRVLITYNPKNTDEQVSLSCD